MTRSAALITELSVLVLAGGAGRRMGGRKAERELHGARLVDKSFELAQRLSDDVLLAAADSQLECPAGIRRLADDPALQGPAAGLIPGLHAARHAWLLLLPCDLLAPSEPVVRELLQRAETQRAADLGQPPPQAVVVVDAGGRQPFHALWAPSGLAQLQARLASGGCSMISLLDALSVCEVPAAELDHLDPTRGYLCDVDTPEDLRAARRGDLP